LKHGWLLKKGRSFWSKWEKRYFVLESGDAVRSAVLRYFTRNPTDLPFSQWKSIEREDKSIILWDAKNTKAKAGFHYLFTDGTECFKIYHFYRDFRFCVPGSNDASEDRDEWMNLVQDAIKFPSEQ